MALSLSSIFKKSNGPVMDFRGKKCEYEFTETDGVYTLFLGRDGRVKNSWNDPVWIRVVYEKENGHITCSATKSEASVKDGKVLFANYPTILYPEFLPLEESEKQMFIDFMVKNCGIEEESANE